MSFAVLLAIALTLLQAADARTTLDILMHGGGEDNDLVRWFIAKLGVFPAILGLKAIAAALAWVIALAPVVDATTECIRLLVLVLLGLGYGWVAWHNWAERKRQKEG